MGFFTWLSERWRAWQERQAQNRYVSQLAEWERDDAGLQQEIQLASEPEGVTGSNAVPIVLHKGESAFLVASGAALIEPKQLPGRWVGSYSGVSFRVMKGVSYHVGGTRGHYVPGPDVPAPIAKGTVTVTNQRVVFQSDQQAREWAFAKLLGYQHDPSKPVTYFQVSNRQKVSGIGYGMESSRVFRFRLGLALAHFRGEIPALLAHLKKEAEDHAAAKPQAPPTMPGQHLISS
jgi:hypothetical protein